MKTLTVKMPAFLASALVNGDTSGLECSCGVEPRCMRDDDRDPNAQHTGDCDFRWLQAALDYCAPGHVVSTANEECDCGAAEQGEDVCHSDDCAHNESAEPSFGRWCDLPGWHLGADMLDYVVLYPDAPKVNS